MGYVVGISVVTVIVLLGIYLFYRSDLAKEVKKKAKKVAGVVIKGDVVLVDKPMIFSRKNRNGTKYDIHEMVNPEFRMGGDEACDAVLQSPTVEVVHAVIRKRNKNGREYFELENRSKMNPVKYYDSAKHVLVPMKYGAKRELGEREAFMVGEYKVQFRLPEETEWKPTERVGVKPLSAKDTPEESADTQVIKDEFLEDLNGKSIRI